MAIIVFSVVPVFLIAVVVIVLVVAGIKVESAEGGKDVIKNVYVYLVLFATLMMVIGGSVASFMAIADIIAPAPYYQSFEDYKRWGAEKPYPESSIGQENLEQQLSEEELRIRYDKMV
ncbi:MAG: hypothetical protein SCK28_11425, partial [Bacillota bacterium]|nr:hypothetical protein [Bacillota bacterium]